MTNVNVKPTEIKITDSNINYLTDHDAFKGGKFPYGILNKGDMGVGGTHSSLTSDVPYIIVVPRTALIKGKVAKHPTVLGVHANGASTEEEIYNYLAACKADGIVPKIMVTDASLPKVVNTLKYSRSFAISDFSLLVDEFHTVLAEYDFRASNIRNIINLFPLFGKRACFITGTLPYANFLSASFNNMPITNVVWDYKKPYDALLRHVSKPVKSVTAMCENFNKAPFSFYSPNTKRNEEVKRLFIAINSTNDIINIIKSANLAPEEVNIIVSDTPKNRDKVNELNKKSAYPTEYAIANANEDDKKFNFFTSVAFMGVDFDTDNGLMVIVTDVKKANTVLCPETDIPQIAGRFRNKSNPFYRHFVLYYNVVANSKDKKEEIAKRRSDIEATKAQSMVLLANNAIGADLYKGIMDKLKDDAKFFITQDVNENYVFDVFAEKADLMKLEKLEKSYLSLFALTRTLKKNNMAQFGKIKFIPKQAFDFEMEQVSENNFAKCFELYVKADKENDEETKEYYGAIYPQMAEYLEELGHDKVHTLRYRENDIKNEIRFNDDQIIEFVAQRLKANFVDGEFVSSKELKKFMKVLLNGCGIKGNFKAADVVKFLPDTTTKLQRMEIKGETKVVRGFNINYKSTTGAHLFNTK